MTRVLMTLGIVASAAVSIPTMAQPETPHRVDDANVSTYYDDTVSENVARSVAHELASPDLMGRHRKKLIRIKLSQIKGAYQIWLPMNQTAWEDSFLKQCTRQIARRIMSRCTSNHPVVIHMTNEHFETKTTLEASPFEGDFVVKFHSQLYYKGDVSLEEASLLVSKLIELDFITKENVRTFQVERHGDQVVVRMVVKIKELRDSSHDEIRQEGTDLGRSLSASAFDGKPIRFELCNPLFETFESFSWQISLEAPSEAPANRGINTDYDETLNDLTRAIGLNPNNASAFRDRGEVWLDAGNAANALADLNRAIKLAPQDASVYLGRGNVFFAEQEYSQAIADYNHSIRHDDQNPSAFYNRGLSWLNLESYRNAINDFDTYLQFDSESPETYYNRAQAWFAFKEFDSALSDLTKSIELGWNTAELFNKRGDIHTAKRDYDRALQDYNRAIQLAPEDPLGYYNRAIAWDAKELHARVIEDLNRVLQLDDSFAMGYFFRGNSWYELKNWDSAIADYDKSLSLDAEQPLAFYGRGLGWARKGNFGRAIADFNETIRLDPEFSEAYVQRASARKAKLDAVATSK